MNKFMTGLAAADNYTLTENGAITHKSTLNGLLDLFSMGGAYRSRSLEDCIYLFKKAYDEDPTYALKCLFYLRDCRGGQGQGERRFFRSCYHWLAKYDTKAARRNMKYIYEYGRWDDYFCLMNTALEQEMFAFLKHQLALDIKSLSTGDKEGVSLLGKWLPSENASSKETHDKAVKFRKYLGMTSKEYRKTLSTLRKRINVLERLMSENRWDEIEFDKVPSKAGLKYRNAFARHDLERSQSGVRTYQDFIQDETTKVHADALYPYEVVQKVTRNIGAWGEFYGNATERAAINKYWDNLKDYLNGKSFNGMCVCDTSGSMRGTPLDVAISLSMYCAERSTGPFAGHYISFSSYPQLIKVDGIDFCDKVSRIYRTDLCENTNIEATFDMLLETAIRNNCSQEEIPQQLIIVSDMEFDEARGFGPWFGSSVPPIKTLMEGIADKWNRYGYKMPTLTFWNVDARQSNIPMKAQDGVTFVSGFSPAIFEMVMDNKNPFDLMYSVLDQKRYEVIK